MTPERALELAALAPNNSVGEMLAAADKVLKWEDAKIDKKVSSSLWVTMGGDPAKQNIYFYFEKDFAEGNKASYIISKDKLYDILRIDAEVVID